uniref:Uncharacterized protein n=1 Tax=Setaria italica TaxID=4555 RepID=K4ANH2_SETIT
MSRGSSLKYSFIDLAPNCFSGSCKILFSEGVNLAVSVFPCEGDGCRPHR